jgi:hypothetical protein
MSHFSTLKTSFVSKDHLKKALQDVRNEFGLGPVRENSAVGGFGGASSLAEIVVATRNKGYDIGFRREKGVYGLVADWFGIKDINEEQLASRLARQYAYHAVKEKLDEKGFTLVEEEIMKEDTIHLRVRRAV